LETLATAILAGVNIKATNQYGQTALVSASGRSFYDYLMSERDEAKRVQAEILQVLIQAGANLEAANLCGQTALMWAANNGHTETVQALVEAGANLEAARTGEIYLITAAYRPGPHVKNTRGNGDTALSIATRCFGAKKMQVLKKTEYDLRQQRLAAVAIAYTRANKGNYIYESVLDLAPQIAALTDGLYRSRQYFTRTSQE